MENYYYYNEDIYNNTETIIEKIEEQNLILQDINTNLSNGIMFIGVILMVNILHHLFDAWWKKGGY